MVSINLIPPIASSNVTEPLVSTNYPRLNAEPRCRNIDFKGRCPGETGYIRTTDAPPAKDFAAYKAEEAAKKAAKAAGK